MTDQELWKAIVDIMGKITHGEPVDLDLQKLRLQIARIPSPLDRMALQAATDYALHNAVRSVDGAAVQMAKEAAIKAYPYLSGEEEDPEGRSWDSQFRLAAYVFVDLVQMSGLYEIIAPGYAWLAEKQLSSEQGRALVVQKETELASDFGLTAEDIEALVDAFMQPEIRPLSLPHDELKRLIPILGSFGGMAGMTASGLSNLSELHRAIEEEDWVDLAFAILSLLIVLGGTAGIIP